MTALLGATMTTPWRCGLRLHRQQRLRGSRRPVVPRMPQLREAAHQHLQGRSEALLAVTAGSG